MFLFLIINLLLLKPSSFSIIALDVYENYGTYDLLVKIGLQSHWKMLELGMDLDFLFIGVHELNENDPQIHFSTETITTSISTQEYEFQKIYSTIYFNKHGNKEDIYESITEPIPYDFKLDNIPLLYRTNSLVSSFDTFPLAYTYNNESLSILHLLKERHFIKKLSFALHCDYKEGKGKLYLGGLPTSIKKTFPYMASVPIPNDINYWGTELTSIKINNEKYTINQIVRFSYNERHIFVPMEFMKWLYENAFKDYIVKRKCKYNDWYSEKRFSCNEIEKDFPNIVINIQGIEIVFEKELLFKRQYEKSYDFEMYSSDKMIKNNEWIFGTGFLTYQLVLFSYDNKQIQFYSNILYKGMHKTESIYDILLTKVFLCNSLLMFIFTIFEYIVYNNFKKECFHLK